MKLSILDPNGAPDIISDKKDTMEDDSDHFVIYGNALPTLEEEDASAKKMKPIHIEEQVATDDQGRRRFHGAFTGGFSAGFFNTAGNIYLKLSLWSKKHRRFFILEPYCWNKYILIISFFVISSLVASLNSSS